MITVSTITPQNFPIPAGYNEIITFDVNPAVTPTLQDTVIWWRVYEEQFGIPIAGSAPIIVKSSLESPTPTIIGYDSPLSFTVQMFTEDTLELLRNYYHEATILNFANEMLGGSFGIMTVLDTRNRPP